MGHAARGRGTSQGSLTHRGKRDLGIDPWSWYWILLSGFLNSKVNRSPPSPVGCRAGASHHAEDRTFCFFQLEQTQTEETPTSKPSAQVTFKVESHMGTACMAVTCACFLSMHVLAEVEGTMTASQLLAYMRPQVLDP